VGAPNEVIPDNIMQGPQLDIGTRQFILNKAITTYENPDNHVQSACYATKLKKAGHEVGFLVVTNQDVDTAFGPEYADLMRLYKLLHEVGHARCGLRSEDEENPTGEIAADSYAALSFLQRFGQSALPLISQLSWLRSFHALGGSTNHLSSFALDKIAIDYKAGKLSNLSESNIVALSQSYAKDWTPHQQELLDVQKKFKAIIESIGPGKEHGTEALLRQTFLSSPNALGIYVVAKALVPLVQPGTIYKGRTLDLPEADNYRAIIRNQYAKTGLSAVFDSKAARVDPQTMLNMLASYTFVGKPLKYKSPSLS
jgi:hypothetical protein